VLVASDIKNGMILRIEKNLYKLAAFQYRMGGGRMGDLVHVKLKDMQPGLFLDRKVKPEQKVERVDLDRRTLEFLYKDTDGYYMMDPESFEQIQMGKKFLGTFDPFLQPSMKLPVEFLWVKLKVVSTVHSISSLQDEVYKPAILSNGMEIQVPQFKRYARKSRLSNLGMNGILSKRSQVEPGM
jgi:elongation factor P